MVRTDDVIESRTMNVASKISLCRLLVLSIAWLLGGAGCSSASRSPALVRGPAVSDASYWHGDNMVGDPSVRISLSEQRAYFYKGGQLAGMSLISSGREGLDTVTGEYRILQKDVAHQSSLFGNYVDAQGATIQRDVDTSRDPRPAGAYFEGTEMPHWMRITGGTGMHEGFLPGYPASHGCIRLPGFMAEAFFQSLSVGTPVSIQP
jgi:hypothetical protein